MWVVWGWCRPRDDRSSRRVPWLRSHLEGHRAAVRSIEFQETTGMHTRRNVMSHAAAVAGMMAVAGLLPSAAQAAWSQAAFEAKSMADAVKALGGAAPAESKDVTLT